MKHHRQAPASGFTLVEVMVSLGIFAFAIVVIVGSLGSSGASAGNDARRTLAVEILHNCFRDLEFAMVPSGTLTATYGLEPIVWDAKPPEVRLWFDAQGRRVADADRAFFRCDLTPARDAVGALGHLYGRVEWPAKRRLGAPDGRTELFTSWLLP